MKTTFRLNICYGVAALYVAATSMGCGRNPNTESSDLLVTDVAHSEVKRQSIGNCWLYAAGTWVESLRLSGAGEEVNVSESYWTWWHFYNQIAGGYVRDEVSTGGSWNAAANIIWNHGIVYERDFIPEEANQQMSSRQAAAKDYMNRSLSTGLLSRRLFRTQANIRAELDRAFGVNMAAAEQRAISVNRYMAGKDLNGSPTTLAWQLQNWQEYSYPRISGQNTRPSPQTTAARNALMSRVFRAMNARHPVVITLRVDFNGIDITDGTFKASTLRARGASPASGQGGHLLVAEDYSVDNVPGYGSLGFGDMPDNVKTAAAQGTLNTLRTKNSWGTNRPERGLTDGYTGFDTAYLNESFEWKAGDFIPRNEWSSPLESLVLPPGF